MFKKSQSKKNLIGLDVGSSAVKAVELGGKRGNLSLTSLGYEYLQPDTIVDGQIMELNDVSNVISAICSTQQIKTERVAAGVSGHSVIVKNITLPRMSDEELEESIAWHAEEHIPFDINDVSLDYQVVGGTPEHMQVLLAACKRDRIANLRQAVQLAGKTPAIVDVDAFALQNCYEVNYEPTAEQVVALLNIGASTMNINIVQGTNSVFTRDVTLGGNQYTSLLQKELGVTFEEADAVKRTGKMPDGTEPANLPEIIETVSDMLALEVQKTFDFYRATAEDSQAAVQKILISGGAAKLRGLDKFLAERFEMAVEVFNPFRKISVDARRFDPDWMREIVPEMAVAVGLALRGVEV